MFPPAGETARRIVRKVSKKAVEGALPAPIIGLDAHEFLAKHSQIGLRERFGVRHDVRGWLTGAAYPLANGRRDGVCQSAKAPL